MNPDIAEVRTRVDLAVAGLPGNPFDAADELSRLEMICVQVLDSEHDDYPPGLLQELLMSYLYIRQIELGLIQGPAPEEE
jgi:hypothetical protein